MFKSCCRELDCAFFLSRDLIEIGSFNCAVTSIINQSGWYFGLSWCELLELGWEIGCCDLWSVNRIYYFKLSYCCLDSWILITCQNSFVFYVKYVFGCCYPVRHLPFLLFWSYQRVVSKFIEKSDKAHKCSFGNFKNNIIYLREFGLEIVLHLRSYTIVLACILSYSGSGY